MECQYVLLFLGHSARFSTASGRQKFEGYGQKGGPFLASIFVAHGQFFRQYTLGQYRQSTSRRGAEPPPPGSPLPLNEQSWSEQIISHENQQQKLPIALKNSLLHIWETKSEGVWWSTGSQPINHKGYFTNFFLIKNFSSQPTIMPLLHQQ